MPLQIVRPSIEKTSDDWRDMQSFLLTQWQRANKTREEQLRTDYARAQKIYDAVPREKIRTTPWPGASNVVVPLARIFLDTFVARSLNIILATQPQYVLPGAPREHGEALSFYLSQKSQRSWNHYALLREVMHSGNKNGTSLIKTVWDDTQVYSSRKTDTGYEDVLYSDNRGPKQRVIPFEDFCLFPHRVQRFGDVQIFFQRIRYTSQEIDELQHLQEGAGQWDITKEQLQQALKTPNDIKQQQVETSDKIHDPQLQEADVWETHFTWKLQDTTYQLVALLIPAIDRMVDLYFYPYNCGIIQAYTPFPTENLFYGKSQALLLASLQEEATAIHNDRRNNSYIANAPAFKKRKDSFIPNPSTNWWPGKVWELDSLEDLEMFSVGRNYDNMLDQEMHVFSLSEKLLGIGPVMQGASQGSSGGKSKGVYNARGTLALLSESNTRQQTNIRDVREVIGATTASALNLQVDLLPDDPILQTFPDEQADGVRAAFEWIKKLPPGHLNYIGLEASNSGVNKEWERQNLLQIAAILSQYGSVVQQYAGTLQDPDLNPIVRSVMTKVIEMHKWMSERLMKAFDEYDTKDVLPDLVAILNGGAEAGGAGAAEVDIELLDSGGAGEAGGMADARRLLESVTQIPTAPGRPQ